MIKKILENRDRINIDFTYMFIIIMTFSKAIGLSTQAKLYYILAAVAMCFWFVAIAFSKNSQKEWIVIICMLAFGGISYYYSKSLVIVMLVMTLTVLKGKNIETILKYMGLTWLISTSLGMIGCTIGLIPIEWHGPRKIQMFYPGPNTFHMSIDIAFFFIFMIKNRIKMPDYVLLTIINVFTYLLSRSLAGVVIGFAIIAGYMVWNITKEYEKVWAAFSKIMLLLNVVLIVFSIVSGLLYEKGNPLFEKIDKFFTNRIHVMKDISIAYRVPLMGQKFDGRIEYELIDNAFFSIIYQFGIIVFIVIMALYIALFIKCYKEKRYLWIMNSSIFFVYGIVELGFRHCFLNFTMLYLADVIWSKKSEVSEKNAC